VTPLLFADGLSVTANSSFSRLLYQTSDGQTLKSYLHDIKSGLDISLPQINPLPTQCAWSRISGAVVYCAAPTQPVAGNYYDSWLQGLNSSPEAIFKINTDIDARSTVANPGSSDGGEQSDIAQIAVSPDDTYLVYIRRGDRSLWGVRLGN
jgi:hypothetical protein